MKINPFNVYRNIQKNCAAPEKSVSRSNDTRSDASKQDKLTLSSEAQQFSKILQKARDAEDFRLDKVNSIKERIENGTYNVSSSDVAKKIIDAARQGRHFRK